MQSLFKEDRKAFESKWDDLKLFINYGMLSEPETFYDRAKDFSLFKDTEGKYFTFDEYKTLIKDNQTDKNDNLVYLYATNVEDQYSFIESAKNKGYSVLLLDGQLDVPAIQMLESKFEKSHFVRVDSDVVDRLIQKDQTLEDDFTSEQRDSLSQAFRSQLPTLDKAMFDVEVRALGEDSLPIVITQSEYMRRMKDMSKYQQGMGFYAQMPDSYQMVVNSNHALIQQILSAETQATEEALKPIRSELKGQEARLAALHQSQDKKKPEEITQEEKDDLTNTEKAINEQKDKLNAVIADFAKDNKAVHQLIDLALLQNGMLKGAALDQFLKRSVEMISK